MLFRRNFPIKNEQIYFQHQIPVDLQIPRSRWLPIKSRKLLAIRFLTCILTLIRFAICAPYKCLRATGRLVIKLIKHRRLSFLHDPSDENHHSCEYGSVKFYIYCGICGMLSCAITHTAVVPLDLIKCRLQVKPQKYENLIHGFQTTIAEEGVFGLTKGWTATFIGYSLQGFGKFGFYEVLKSFFWEILGEDDAYRYRTVVYLLASASAELFADVALAPWEAIKVRIQTQDNWASTLGEGLPKFYAEEGLWGFYKGIVPLWLRQIPYTMMKFACFERTIEALYKYLKREQRTRTEELAITFIAGYIAGIFCAIVSHPADTIVSKLNNEKGLNSLDAIRRVGFAGLWKGLLPRIFITGTLSAMQLFFYNSAKVILGVPRM